MSYENADVVSRDRSLSSIRTSTDDDSMRDVASFPYVNFADHHMQVGASLGRRQGLLSIASAILVDESGQGLVEYALILFLVSLVAITGLTLFGGKTNNSLNTSANRMP